MGGFLPSVSALAVFGSTIYAGGGFTEICNTVQPNFAGITADVASVSEREELPSEFALHQNYPNPFNPATIIRYSLPVGQDGILSCHVSLKVYNLLGQEVATLVNESKQPGRYQVQWNAQRLSSGVYFYRLQAGEYLETRKLMLLK